jgi:S1-C subfamily serine protease
MRRVICGIAVILAVIVVQGRAYAGEPIVSVMVTSQNDHPFYPWQMLKPRSKAGFGVVIDRTHVLVTESLVRSQTLIEIRLPHSGRNIPVELVKADSQVNLALLKVADSNILADVDYPVLGDKLPLHSAVTIVQIDETSGVQKGDGSVVKALVEGLPHAPYALLQYDILTGLNVTGSGAPVFYQGQMAGIMISYRSGSRTGKMLPSVFIRRFVDDVMDGDYAGFASAGFSWKRLVDPVKRKYLGVGDIDGGIQIVSCMPGTGAGRFLKPNDVVIGWGGHVIDNLGYYQDDNYGRLLFPNLVKMSSPGDSVTLAIMRAGKRMELKLPLAHHDEFDDYIPENTVVKACDYIVVGGLVIQELNGRMLRAYGQDWEVRVDSRLAHLYLTQRQSPDQPGDHVVLLSRVLDDPINISYQGLNNQIIEKVNGKPVRNIAEVFKIKKADGAIERVTLQSVGVDIVLDRDTLDEADKRIMRQYRLPRLQRETER